MIKEFIDAWYKRKDDLQEYFETTPMGYYDSYEALVKIVFEKIVNPGMISPFNLNKVMVLDDGGYSGTQVFILHRDLYEPSVYDYVYTNTYYGSCSGCDTLLSIQSYGEHLPDEKQVKEHMTLCLQLLEKCNWMLDE